MRKSRFSDERMIGVLREQGRRMPTVRQRWMCAASTAPANKRSIGGNRSMAAWRRRTRLASKALWHTLLDHPVKTRARVGLTRDNVSGPARQL